MGAPVQEQSTDALVGSVVDGRYRIVEPIGSGGMARVYRATSPDGDVALKLPNENLNGVAKKRFDREITRLGEVGDGCVRLIGHGIDPTLGPYLAMELLGGMTLQQRIDGPHAMRPVVAVGIALDLLDTLAAVHAQGVVHRDLKPSNVFLTDDGRTVLLDFGVARLAQHESNLTGTGSWVGTPRYVAPEVTLGTAADGRADLYAVGCILATCLTGQQPFQDVKPHALILSIRAGEQTPVADLNVRIGSALSDVVDTARAVDPARRYQSAASMAAALRALPLSELERSANTTGGATLTSDVPADVRVPDRSGTRTLDAAGQPKPATAIRVLVIGQAVTFGAWALACAAAAVFGAASEQDFEGTVIALGIAVVYAATAVLGWFVYPRLSRDDSRSTMLTTAFAASGALLCPPFGLVLLAMVFRRSADDHAMPSS